MPALHTVFDVKLHVVAQVVEPKFVVGAVGDIGGVGSAPLLIVKIVYDDADGEAEKTVEPAHPFGVTFGQIVVDGDHVYATPTERAEIYGKSGDQRLAFAGLHF